MKIERVEVAEAGDLLLVRVLGSHFLWKMVRRMVGVLAEVGRGGLAPRTPSASCASRPKLPATLTAPPSGLFLERVLYEGDAPPGPLRPVLNLVAAAAARAERAIDSVTQRQGIRPARLSPADATPTPGSSQPSSRAAAAAPRRASRRPCRTRSARGAAAARRRRRRSPGSPRPRPARRATGRTPASSSKPSGRMSASAKYVPSGRRTSKPAAASPSQSRSRRAPIVVAQPGEVGVGGREARRDRVLERRRDGEGHELVDGAHARR